MKRNNYITTLILATLYINGVLAQASSPAPKLVVAITVDQLRAEYMEAFESLYSEKGFKKLFSEGKVFERATHDFTPVDRASATATISTGAVPFYNGIVSSSWIDRNTLRPVSATDDKKYEVSLCRDAVSARKLLSTTIGDELKVYTQGAAKVFAIAPSMDAALLSAGHAADCAVWVDDKTGRWTTTDYYANANSNDSWIGAYERLHPLALNIDGMRWEPASDLSGNISFFMGGGLTEPFRHTFKGDMKFVEYKRSRLINSDITDIALQCISSNVMGTDDITDLISVTYYAGLYDKAPLSQCHRELQDTYYCLDRELERLISTVEKSVGKENVLFVFTSTGYDETVTTDYAKMGIPSGTFYINRTANLLNMYLSATYGQAQYVDAVYHNQIFFNHKLLEQKRLSLIEILTSSREFLMLSDGIRDIHTAERILSPTNKDMERIRNAYNPTLCGDIVIEVAPGWKVVNEDTGETYDVNATQNIFPIVFYGASMKSERISTLVTTDCIAPTICKCIRIRAPNACKSLPLF